MNSHLFPCCFTVKTTQLPLHIIELHSSFSQYLSVVDIDEQEFEKIYLNCQKKEITSHGLLGAFKSALKEVPTQSIEIMSLLPFINANDFIIVSITPEQSNKIYLHQIQKKLEQSDYFSSCCIEVFNNFQFISTSSSLVKLSVVESSSCISLLQLLSNVTEELRKNEILSRYVYVLQKLIQHVIPSCSLFYYISFVVHFMKWIKTNKDITKIPSYLSLKTTALEFCHLKELLPQELSSLSSIELFPNSIFSTQIIKQKESNVVACAGIPSFVSVFDIQHWLKPYRALRFLMYQPSFCSAQTQRCGVVFIDFDSIESALIMIKTPQLINARYAKYFDPLIFKYPPSGYSYCTMEPIEWVASSELHPCCEISITKSTQQ
ncbi:hypothetical protein ENUP19_0248G0075 [Entamoeba nuttalli]|uniref:Uncharacterized protein n=2 Tax=Entamoeba nuttalli TaxID=412467 RepID=K2HZF4_ENTNP|nr:hypothetical protein ENU1_043930 [Entamoeba nuttalli P19]EKE41815.1 hypothetical protein ENU1_043930 [Entamoeba nuttalli P19]|eukprot:XP_008855855.1 hypothetical protein ENU1_043930 [Entamoeba nuttalli P19]